MHDVRTHVGHDEGTAGGLSRSQRLGDRYATHNLQRGRGFLYGGADRVQAMRALLPEAPGRVLDLGCRDGALAAALHLPPDGVVGADIDHEALVSARAREALRPCRADLWGPLPFASGAFDLVVAGEILEHVPFPEELVAEMARVLRPGGRVVGSVPNAFRFKNRLMFLAGRWFEQDPTHLRQFSPRSLRELLEARFSSVEIRACVGRLARLWPRALGNDLVWTGLR